MGLRIHFTADDLARVRVAPGLGPLMETWFGLALLRCPTQRPPLLSGWREQARRRADADVARAAALIPRGSLGVDFTTLIGESGTIDEGLEALRALSTDRIQGEVDALSRLFPVSRDMRTIAEDDGDARRELAGTLRSSYRTLVEPYWDRIGAHLHTERALRGRVMADGGVDALFRSLAPARVRWTPPVMHVPMPWDADVHLAGRGLDLVPSLLIGELAVFLEDTRDRDQAPRLVLPTTRDPLAAVRLWSSPQGGAPAEHRSLSALLGRTRARVLHRIADGCTTTELATFAGISPAAASQHATVLRGAGLVATRRRGGEVLHTLTPLGHQLIALAG